MIPAESSYLWATPPISLGEVIRHLHARLKVETNPDNSYLILRALAYLELVREDTRSFEDHRPIPM